MCAEEVFWRFLAKWPTYFKPKILADCKNLTSDEHVEDLLSAQQNADHSGEFGSLFSLKYLFQILCVEFVFYGDL